MQRVGHAPENGDEARKQSRAGKGGEGTQDGVRRPSQAGSDCNCSGTALRGYRQGHLCFEKRTVLRRGGKEGGKSRSRRNRMRPLASER